VQAKAPIVPADNTPRIPAHVGENAAAASPPKAKAKRTRKAKGGPK
jgi:hypothetical protein